MRMITKLVCQKVCLGDRGVMVKKSCLIILNGRGIYGVCAPPFTNFFDFDFVLQDTKKILDPVPNGQGPISLML